MFVRLRSSTTKCLIFFNTWLLSGKDGERVSVLVLALSQRLQGGHDLAILPGELLAAPGHVADQRAQRLGALLLLHLEARQPVVERLQAPRLLLRKCLHGRQPLAQPLQAAQRLDHGAALAQTILHVTALLLEAQWSTLLKTTK
jgi:hypothetical protein